MGGGGGWQEAIAQLLLVQSSALDSSETTTIDEYIGRQKENDSPIYYILANTRDAAMTSPYMESMLAEEKEVIIMNHPLDVFVVEHLKEVNGKKLVSIESSEVSCSSCQYKFYNYHLLLFAMIICCCYCLPGGMKIILTQNIFLLKCGLLY